MPGKVVAIDAGCRWGLPEGWDSLGDDLVYFGFDPDPDECARLGAAFAKPNAVREFVPVALAPRDGSRSVHVTREPACSSFYPPEPGILEAFPTLETVSVDRIVDVPTQRLDTWATRRQISRVDVIKLDTQGSELEILQGAGSLLDSVALVDTEVEFNPIYAGQPLFGDVDRFLRGAGFVLWRLTNLVHYRWRGVDGVHRSPDHQAFDFDNVGFIRGTGQLYWGHAMFVRKDLLLGGGDKATRQRLIQFASAVGVSDLAETVAVNAAGAGERRQSQPQEQ